MEKETFEWRQARDASGRSIEPIAENRMSDTRQVDTYLVSSAGSDANSKKCTDGQLLENMILGVR
jgi:hypothetical protein